MAFFSGTNDQVCPNATAKKYVPQIQSNTTFIDIEGENHMYFAERANDDWFMTQLIA